MNNDNKTTSIVSAQIISAQIIGAQIISAQISGSATADVSRRLVEVPAGDVDATIAIMEALAEFCASDPAAGRFARLFAQPVHEFEIATLAEGLAVTFTQRLTRPAAPRTEP
jgi:hypothetical protein